MRRRVTGSNQKNKNKLFVAVGNNGVIVTSPDGKEWTKRNSGVTHSLIGVGYGNGLFVAVGYNILLTSPDGIEWTQRVSLNNTTISCITYGNGIFLALFNINLNSSPWIEYGFMTSTDGINWTTHTTETPFGKIIFANNLFVGLSGNLIGTSSDGINWRASIVDTDLSLQALTYGNGLFVAVGTYNSLVTSPDGINWTRRTSQGYLYGVAYGNNSYVAVGNYALLTSLDGLSWYYSNYGPSINAVDLIYGNNLFVGVGNLSGSNPRITTSLTGSPNSWTVIDIKADSRQTLQAITYRDK